jgi:hypothetical protein
MSLFVPLSMARFVRDHALYLARGSERVGVTNVTGFGWTL